VPGNLKLAQRTIVTPDDKPVTLGGKQYKPRKVGAHHEVVVTLIETRGEGGLFLCAPSPGYVLEQSSFENPPILTEAERNVLIEAARALNERVPQPEPVRAVTGEVGRPGDEFNARGDVRALLLKAGWSLVKPGDNEYWRRPGKDKGWSATLKDGVLFVFSSNAAPFESEKAYAPFSVYTLLEHNGDFSAAAAALRAEGFGAEDSAGDVNLAGITAQIQHVPDSDDKEPPGPADPGPLPEELLRVPGFVSEVMDHCLETAPYPNTVMAFCGALALQAFLAGRKVCDPGNNRTNIYLLGLAHSAAGKDWPRKVNLQIAHRVGLSGSLGERFASGEGVQDALFISPTMLFQTDEIDGILQSINKATDARHENVMSTLLTMYSSANSVFPMRRKAGKESPGVIDQPCLVLFGTAIPNHYYEALSERMLTNGFFARMLILEGNKRGKGQEPRMRELPPRVLATAKWWADFRPASGNLVDWHPVPLVVEHTDEAKRALIAARMEAEAEYAAAEERCDPVATTVWGRVSEQTRKLALLHAISVNHENPRIDLTAVQWAARFVLHQTRRMLFMAWGHVADNPFHADCLKLLRKLHEAPGQQLPHSILLKRMKIDAKVFQMLITTLEQRGDVEVCVTPRTGTAHKTYRLPLNEPVKK
jgi:hypothetical protein